MSDQRPVDSAEDRRRVPILGLLSAIGVSQIGNMAVGLAVPWFVLETTGSAARTGFVSAALALGAVVMPALGGPFVDRVGHKRTSVVSDLIASAAIAAIPVLFVAGLLEFWHLLVLIFLQSSFNSQGDAGRYAVMPRVADLAGTPIERANASERSVARFAQFAGPILGGVLITAIGAENVMFLDAITFLLSATLIGLLVPSPSQLVEASKEDSKGYLANLRAGFRFVRRDRLMLSMLLLVAWGNFLFFPLVLVVLPAYAQAFWPNAATLGAALGTFGAGAVTGTLLFGAVGRGWPKRITFLVGFIVAPLIGFGSLAITPPLPVIFVAAFLAGLIAGPINPVLLTVIQQHTPPQILGRVFGVVRATASAGIPVGAILAGYAVEQLAVVPTIVVMGIAYLAVTVSMIFNPALRDMQQKPA